MGFKKLFPIQIEKKIKERQPKNKTIYIGKWKEKLSVNNKCEEKVFMINLYF